MIYMFIGTSMIICACAYGGDSTMGIGVIFLIEWEAAHLHVYVYMYV